VNIKITERYVSGWTDARAVFGTDPTNYPPGDCLFPFDAELRGYDPALFREQTRDGLLYMPWWTRR
jgi:hypothetical protein